MKYYTLHIKDSGAIEERTKETKPVTYNMYDDHEFNSLNDILHSLDDYILNEKALKIFQKSKTVSFDVDPIVVNRKEQILRLFKLKKSYAYYHLSFREEINMECYKWIDFGKSEIKLLKGKVEIGKLCSHEVLIESIIKNKKISSQINEIFSMKISEKEKKKRSENLKTYELQVKKIVFNRQFDSSIDLFRLPHYSWGTYVSERLKKLLEQNNITDLEFAETNEELGTVWRAHYPILKYD